jgi:hypothetical protein
MFTDVGDTVMEFGASGDDTLAITRVSKQSNSPPGVPPVFSYFQAPIIGGTGKFLGAKGYLENAGPGVRTVHAWVPKLYKK